MIMCNSKNFYSLKSWSQFNRYVPFAIYISRQKTKVKSLHENTENNLDIFYKEGTIIRIQFWEWHTIMVTVKMLNPPIHTNWILCGYFIFCEIPQCPAIKPVVKDREKKADSCETLTLNSNDYEWWYFLTLLFFILNRNERCTGTVLFQSGCTIKQCVIHMIIASSAWEELEHEEWRCNEIIKQSSHSTLDTGAACPGQSVSLEKFAALIKYNQPDRTQQLLQSLRGMGNGNSRVEIKITWLHLFSSGLGNHEWILASPFSLP